MFKEKDYLDETFKGSNYSNLTITGTEFKECLFVSCNFSDTVFKNCTFLECKFEDSDLSLAKVPGCIFKGVEFRKSKVIGVNWAEASWGKKGFYQLLHSIDFYECILNYSRFFGLELESIHIRDCVAREADFSEAILRKADLRKTDFENSIFRGTNLEGANLSEAKNYLISPTLNVIKKAIFTLPEALALLYSMDIIIGDSYQEDS